MCGDCANINRSLLVRHSLMTYSTNVQGGITWLVLSSIDKLKQLFPNPLSIDEDFFLPAPDSGGAGDGGEDPIPPTLRNLNDPNQLGKAIKEALGVPAVCKKHYYGVGECTCGKGRR